MKWILSGLMFALDFLAYVALEKGAVYLLGDGEDEDGLSAASEALALFTSENSAFMDGLESYDEVTNVATSAALAGGIYVVGKKYLTSISARLLKSKLKMKPDGITAATKSKGKYTFSKTDINGLSSRGLGAKINIQSIRTLVANDVALGFRTLYNKVGLNHLSSKKLSDLTSVIKKIGSDPKAVAALGFKLVKDNKGKTAIMITAATAFAFLLNSLTRDLVESAERLASKAKCDNVVIRIHAKVFNSSILTSDIVQFNGDGGKNFSHSEYIFIRSVAKKFIGVNGMMSISDFGKYAPFMVLGFNHLEALLNGVVPYNHDRLIAIHSGIGLIERDLIVDSVANDIEVEDLAEREFVAELFDVDQKHFKHATGLELDLEHSEDEETAGVNVASVTPKKEVTVAQANNELISANISANTFSFTDLFGREEKA